MFAFVSVSLLYVHVNFSIAFFLFCYCEEWHWNFMAIALKLHIAFGNTAIFILLTQYHRGSFIFLVSFFFFSYVEFPWLGLFPVAIMCL